ncbi:uncharacterized protein LOC128237255 [Mya arenaria]|uniref:uncharacterized protein LOC128237255 n=1 Tax=Mya arenaria TaxID=6604 RepID=UPI0022E1E6D3|nr:uncharacterized protein LOC128237255 [Mya arenaria]
MLALVAFGFVLFNGVYGEANISISGNVMTKPSPSPGLDPNKWVNISLTCVGDKGLSYFITNHLNWIFESNVDGNVTQLTKQSFYNTTADYKYELEYREISVTDGYFFKMNIYNVGYSDDGTYSCVLYRPDKSIIVKKDANVTVIHPVDNVKMSLRKNENDSNQMDLTQHIKEGKYTIQCKVTGSNPPPVIDLTLVNGRSRHVNKELIKTVKDRRVAFTTTATMYDTLLLKGNRTFICSANLPNDVLQKYPEFHSVNTAIQVNVITTTPIITCNSPSSKDGEFAAQCQLKSHDQLFCDDASLVTMHNGRNMTYEGNHTSPGINISCTAANQTALTVNLQISKQKVMEVKQIVVRYSMTAEYEVPFYDATTTTTKSTTKDHRSAATAVGKLETYLSQLLVILVSTTCIAMW